MLGCKLTGRKVRYQGRVTRRRLVNGVVAMTFAFLCSISTVSAEGRDEVIYFFNNSLGSAIAAINESGELCWSENYTPYGDKTINDDVFAPPGSGCGIVGEERGFTGHTEDVNSDLVYMQQRYYDPSTGRFLSIDPLDANPEDPKTYNRYAYANNNPYKYVDRNGEFPALAYFATPPGIALLTSAANWTAGFMGVALVSAAAVDVMNNQSGDQGDAGENNNEESGTQRSRGYDRPEVETKSGTAVKQKDATDRWDNFLGDDQTNIDPRDGLPDPDRIWSGDGTRSIRYGDHEMNSKPNKEHYHQETWSEDRVDNELQRIPR